MTALNRDGWDAKAKMPYARSELASAEANLEYQIKMGRAAEGSERRKLLEQTIRDAREKVQLLERQLESSAMAAERGDA
jgi:hypothetical protein